MLPQRAYKGLHGSISKGLSPIYGSYKQFLFTQKTTYHNIEQFNEVNVRARPSMY